MSQKQYSTRLPADDAERLEQYCDEQGISKSEAIRRSVRDRLEDRDGSDQDSADLLWAGSMVTGILVILLTVSGLISGLVSALGGIPVLALFTIWAVRDRDVPVLHG